MESPILATALRETIVIEAVFSRIYDRNAWQGDESRSGLGSGVEATRVAATVLRSVIERLGVRRVLDAPCGDVHWMKEFFGTVEEYVGVDVVPALIVANRARHGRPGVEFLEMDLANGVPPRADLAFCRDCLAHLPPEIGQKVLRNLRASGARWLLATTYPETVVNRAIAIGGYWPMNLTLAPFELPPPVASFGEGSVGKFLGLWDLAALNSLA